MSAATAAGTGQTGYPKRSETKKLFSIPTGMTITFYPVMGCSLQLMRKKLRKRGTLKYYTAQNSQICVWIFFKNRVQNVTIIIIIAIRDTLPRTLS